MNPQNIPHPGVNALKEMLVGRENIPSPPIPDDLVLSISPIDPDVFGTRADASALYDIEWFVGEVVSQPTSDYIMIGFSGHGTNSQALHYYIVQEHLALFLQLSWGSVFIDKDYAITRISDAFKGVRLVLDAIEDTKKHNLIEKDQRLIIVESDFIGSGWSWIKGQPGSLEDSWNTDVPTFLNALLSIPKPT